MYRNTHLDSDKINMREFGKRKVNKQFIKKKKKIQDKTRNLKSINPEEY